MDSPGGIWTATDDIHGEDTILISESTFTVYAYFDEPSNGLTLNDNYIFAASVVPILDNGDDFGSFSIDGAPYNSANADYGSLPVTNHDPLNGDTYYYTETFNFDAADTVTGYNVEDNPGTTPDTSGTGMYLYCTIGIS